jgi:hypothetical protein
MTCFAADSRSAGTRGSYRPATEQQPSQLAFTAERAADVTTTAAEDEEKRECAACQHQLGLSAYNRTQRSKGPGKSRRRSCIEAAIGRIVI